MYYADSIAKQLYKKNKALKKKLIETFGTGLLDNRKMISPLKLRRLVFVSKPNQRRVGRIVHPFVISEINKRIKQNSNDYIVIEAALIFESRFDKYLDYTLLIHSNIKTRIRRIVKRDNKPVSEVRKIIKLQMPEKEKITRADFVITNNGTLNELKKNVRLVFEVIKKTKLRPSGNVLR